MPGVDWNLKELHTYTSGVSNGVVFPATGSPFVWNGLRSVENVIASNNAVPRYLDGRKMHDHVPRRIYQGVVSSYTIPRQFAPFLGEVDVVPGVTLTKQPRVPFNFSYETRKNEDGRIIHLIYNATATQTSLSYSTVRETVAPLVHKFKIDAVPPASSVNWPSAHLILDSTRMPDFIFASVLEQLYGSATKAPAFPSQDFINYLVGNPLIEPLIEPI